MSCCKQQMYYPYRYVMPPPYIYPNYPSAEFPSVFIRGKEIDCWFAGVLEERRIDGLVFQYDKGLILNIKGVDTEAINCIEFAKAGDADGVTAHTPTVVDPTATEEEDDGDDNTDDPVDPQTDPSGDPEPEPESEPEEEPASTDPPDPATLPYLSCPIPDDLLTTSGTVVAYCVYKTENEYRTVKTINITVHPRMKVKEPSESEEEGCGCETELTELRETIAALTERIAALEGGGTSDP